MALSLAIFIVFACALTVNAMSLPEKLDCFDQHEIPHPSVVGETIGAFRNVGGCTCPEAAAQATAKNIVGQFIPGCDGNKFQSEQFSTSGHRFCVDLNGHQISEMWQPWVDRNRRC